MNDTPLMVTEAIPTTDEHLRGFARKHDMEHSSSRLTAITDDKIWFETRATREMHSLETPLFGAVVIDVTSIKRSIALQRIDFKMHRAELNQRWIDYTIASCGVEMDHVDQLELDGLDRPGILIEFITRAGSHQSFVDGNHRMVRRWREGLRRFDFAYVTAYTVADFIVRPGEEDSLFERAREGGLL